MPRTVPAICESVRLLITDRNLLFEAGFKRQNWFFLSNFRPYIPR